MKNSTEVFQALGNRVRFEIVKTLIKEKKRAPKGRGICVCELIKGCGVANSTMTHHLDWLRSAGILTSERKGQWIYYDVNLKKIDELKRFVEDEL